MKKEFFGMLSSSPQMLEIFDTVSRLAPFSSNILISGESGTGKELLARAIHSSSIRKNQKFVAVNCGAIPENLIESELFGHKKGAFTDAVRDKKGLLEEANEGTLFLDEIGEMPLLLQVKLLRVLQERELRPVGDENLVKIDIRVIAATNRNLDLEVKDGRFREDLFYRLNVVSLELPALRERGDDLKLLSQHFIENLKIKMKFPDKSISAAALQKLSEYNWPGNIRELENSLERLVLLSPKACIDLEDLPEHIKNFAPTVVSQLGKDRISLSLKKNCELLETSLIKEALIRTEGNRTHAAKLLEISHRALLYKIKEYGLTDFMKD
jgi:two-component system response regulator AtoC